MKISKSFNRFSYVLIVFLSMLFTFTACEEDEVLEPEREVALNLEYAHMTVGNDLVLTPLFGNIQSPMAEYKWEVSDSTVIEISSVAKNYAATIKAIGEGTATAN